MLSDSSILASVSSLHVAIAIVRKHRARRARVLSPFVVPSFLFAGAPWVWSSPIGLAAGIGAHLLWFAVCEMVAPATSTAATTPAAARPSAPRPAPAVRATAPAAAAPVDFVSTPVLAVLDEAEDIKTFRLARPERFEFRPGQFVPVRVSVDGKPHVRCYSISSSPDARGYLEISVRRQGLVSTMLHASLRTGALLSIRPPAGAFVYPSGDDRPLALLAGGIGITPLLAMLRHAVAADPSRPVALFYSARDRQAVAFLSELRVLAERHPQVRIAVTLSADADAPAPWRHGHIDAALLRTYVAHPPHTVFCICGPTPMMAAMESLLRAEGVPPGQIRSEQFSTAMAAASLSPAATVAAEPAAMVASPAPGGYRVRFASSGREASANGTRTILEVAECEGVAIASSCRAGVCQACRTRLVDGQADCQSSVLDAADRAAGFVLPCVTYALGDCVLEA